MELVYTLHELYSSNKTLKFYIVSNSEKGKSCPHKFNNSDVIKNLILIFDFRQNGCSLSDFIIWFGGGKTM